MKPMSERGEEDFGMLVAVIILLFFARVLGGQEIENLGIVSARRGIILERQNTNRTDFLHFVLELPHSSNTNIVTTLIRTNDFLNLDDFGTISDGPIVLILREVYSDGDESPVALFRVEIRRTRLTKPRARGITIAGTNHATLQDALQSRKASRTNSMGSAPMPGSVASGSGKSSGDLPPMGTPSGGPMRGGSNETYSEHMAKMAEYFKQKTRK